jgi:hypothetical protein
MIANILDANEIPQETIRAILQTLVDYLEHKKNGPIQIDNEYVAQMMNAELRTVAVPWKDLLDRPIKLEELKTVVHRGQAIKPRVMIEYVWPFSR